VNTGWSGGPYGVGSRMKLGYTRAMVRAALDGTLAGAPTTTDPVFGLAVPQVVAGVPSEIMNPRGTWPDGSAYDAQAHKLAGMFRDNFKKFEGAVGEEIVNAGPRA
jgi:phosphoenolpyruvate carboxykinase (ATP)